VRHELTLLRGQELQAARAETAGCGAGRGPCGGTSGPRRARSFPRQSLQARALLSGSSASVRVLPEGYRPYFFHGHPYYFHGGDWYAPGASGFVVVRPPIGVVISVLQPYYSTPASPTLQPSRFVSGLTLAVPPASHKRTSKSFDYGIKADFSPGDRIGASLRSGWSVDLNDKSANVKNRDDAEATTHNCTDNSGQTTVSSSGTRRVTKIRAHNKTAAIIGGYVQRERAVLGCHCSLGCRR
jgi:hypothetical protein